jgi:hypothetical protein
MKKAIWYLFLIIIASIVGRFTGNLFGFYLGG